MDCLATPEKPSESSGLICPECDYNLTGATGDRCPWCGWRINADELIAARSMQHEVLRFAVILAGLIIGIGTVLVVWLLVRRQRLLSMRDGMLMVGVLLAAAGHLVAAIGAFFSAKRWPMRHRELARIISFLACASIIIGILGATSLFRTERMPHVVRGVIVSGVFEFVLTAALFTFPGWALIVVRLAAFRTMAAVYDRTGSLAPSDGIALPTEVPFKMESAVPLAREHVHAVFVNQARAKDPCVEASIARTWGCEVALAEGTDRILYNGSLTRLIRFDVGERTLRLLLGPTCYRDFVGTNLQNVDAKKPIGDELLADPLGISGNVITSDGYLLFGRRSTRVACHAGYLHAFGGMVERSQDLGEGRVDVFDQMLRELTEELPVTRAQVKEITVIGMVRDKPSHQPELLFDILLDLPRRNVLDRFDPNFGEGEHVAIESIFDDPQQIARFIDQAAPMAPVSQAALLLHGKHMWGDEWFSQSCFLLYGTQPICG